MVIPVNLEFYARDGRRAAERGDVTVVIDVFRCSSTIVTALRNGAAGILPVRTVKTARRLHEVHPSYLLAGERGGVKPKGFDLGNSPREFAKEIVRGKHIILTTTDGTKALQASRGGGPVLVGSFLNAEAVSKALYNLAKKEGRGISLVASGLKGRASLEDILCAGRIIEYLPKGQISLSDAALIALLASKGVGDDIEKITRSSSHGRELELIGLGEDLHFCTRLNVYEVVPIMRGDEIVSIKKMKSASL